MDTTTIKIGPNEFKNLVKDLLSKQISYDLLTKKNKISFYNDQKLLFTLRPPLHYPHLTEDIHEWLMMDFLEEYVIVLTRSGIASLGLWSDDHFKYHKVFRSYMNRKKQGKSQITFLKTKGKSRAGSRVRLENAKIFFGDISEYINKINPLHQSPIFYFVPIPSLSFWRESNTPPPKCFHHPESKRIPLNVKTPNFDELKRVNQILRKAEITITDPLVYKEWKEFFERSRN